MLWSPMNSLDEASTETFTAPYKKKKKKLIFHNKKIKKQFYECRLYIYIYIYYK